MLLISDDLFVKETIDSVIQELRGFTSKILELMDMDMNEIAENDRRILAVFCYGALKTIIKSEKFVEPQVYAITVEVLLHNFHYDEEQAMELSHILIKTEEHSNEYLYNIMKKGAKGYYQYAERGDEILKQTVFTQLHTVTS